MVYKSRGTGKDYEKKKKSQMETNYAQWLGDTFYSDILISTKNDPSYVVRIETVQWFFGVTYVRTSGGKRRGDPSPVWS